MKKRKSVLLSIFMVMLLNLIAPATTFAETSDYDSVDVTTINTLIDFSGLQATKDDPDSWDFAVWDKTAHPYRLKELDLSNKGLRSRVNITNLQLEKLDISENPEIVQLQVSNNKLRELNIDGLKKLRLLDGSYNALTQINITEEHESLVDIQLEYNQLTSLDIPVLGRLQYVSCEHNKLTTFALADIGRFDQLNIDFNELETLSLKNLPYLYTLTASNNRLTNVHGENLGNLNTVKLDSQQPAIELVGNAKHGYSANADFLNPTFTDSQGTALPALKLSYQPGKLSTADATLAESNFTSEADLEGISTNLSGTIRLTYSTVHVITAKSGEGGSISPSSEVTVKENSNQTFTAKAEKGYRLVKLLVDGKAVPKAVTAGSYTFKNVTDEHTIEAVFEKLPENNDKDGAGGNKENNEKKGGKNTNTGSPKTGDNNTPMLWAFVLFAASGIILIVLLQKRKKALSVNKK